MVSSAYKRYKSEARPSNIWRDFKPYLSETGLLRAELTAITIFIIIFIIIIVVIITILIAVVIFIIVIIAIMPKRREKSFKQDPYVRQKRVTLT